MTSPSICTIACRRCQHWGMTDETPLPYIKVVLPVHYERSVGNKPHRTSTLYVELQLHTPLPCEARLKNLPKQSNVRTGILLEHQTIPDGLDCHMHDFQHILGDYG